MKRSTEYRSGTGKVLTIGDHVKVQGRRGRFVFRCLVIPDDGPPHLELVGQSKGAYGKVYRARPEDTGRRGGQRRPDKHLAKWLKRNAEELVDAPERPAEAPEAKPAPTPPGRTETLTCEACGRAWERPVKRGRKPKRCPSC